MCTAAWGAVTGFTAMFAEEGFQLSHELKLDEVKQGNVTVDHKVNGYRGMVDFLPQQPTTTQLLTALKLQGSGGGIGIRRSSNKADLVVAGSGISDCGPAIAVNVDVCHRPNVASLVRDGVFAYGGIDHVVITAGVFPTPDATGHVPDEIWRRTFDVNVLGAYVVADECRVVWDAQQLAGSLVITTSVNAVVAKN